MSNLLQFLVLVPPPGPLRLCLLSSGSANNNPKPSSLRPWIQLERLPSLRDSMRRSDYRSRRMKTKSGGGAGKRAHERMCVVCGVCAGGSLNLRISHFFWDHHPIRQYYWGNSCKGWRRGMVLIRYLMGGNDSPARSSQYYSLRFWDLTIDGSIGRGSTTEIAIDYPWSVSREVIVFLNSWTDVYPSVKLSCLFWRSHAVLRSTMVHSCTPCQKSVQKFVTGPGPHILTNRYVIVRSTVHWSSVDHRGSSIVTMHGDVQLCRMSNFGLNHAWNLPKSTVLRTHSVRGTESTLSIQRGQESGTRGRHYHDRRPGPISRDFQTTVRAETAWYDTVIRLFLVTR